MHGSGACLLYIQKDFSAKLYWIHFQTAQMCPQRLYWKKTSLARIAGIAQYDELLIDILP